MGFANRVLAPHGYGLGPDPASTDIATVGGVIANNSGGMRCGITWDSYSTVEAMTLVLASGTRIDTAAPGAEDDLARHEPELVEGLLAIRDELRADAELSERVRRKFEIKNTTGYRLCAFLDADSPLEILRRLVVGSEGTLAFVAEAVFRTRPQPARTAIAWLHFPSIEAAVEPVPALVDAGCRAVELMVAPALIAASHIMPGTPKEWQELPPESAALLVEVGGGDDTELGERIEAAEAALGDRELIREHAFVRDHEGIELAWSVREGLFGLVGKLRLPGTALIVEDVCVAPERIADCAKDLQALLGEHGFLTGVAGHASAGNLHFQLTPAFSDPADVERYEKFMEGLVELIVDRYDGSLKSEHGTGPQHGALGRARVGRQGHGDDVARQGAGRPRRGPQPGLGAQPRRRRAPEQPQDPAADRGRGHAAAWSAGSASRCARAATPPPRRGSGSCCAASWRASRRARRCTRRCLPTSSTTRSRPARPTARARWPARWRSTPAR